jgi:enoyl-CoA hydratase/carnithine racemase
VSDQTSLVREVRGKVIAGTLNRPAVLNALDTGLRKELTLFWQEFRDRPDLRVAIVTGSGGNFSSGRDLKETAEANRLQRVVDYEVTGEWGYPQNISIGKPVIAAIDGYCLAAGLAVAAGCDIRICTPRAKFGNPQAKIGRGTRMPYYLTRLGLPRSVIMDMVFTGDAISADDALRWGLVSRVVDAGELMSQAWTIAAEIASNSFLVVSAIKRALEAGVLDLSHNEAMRLWDPLTRIMAETDDARSGTAAFAEGQPPEFGGGPLPAQS